MLQDIIHLILAPSSASGRPAGVTATEFVGRLVPVFGPDALKPETVLVAIPAYNEERFIGSVVHGVRLEGFRCLVIDDASTDRTAEIARAAGAEVERHDRNLGKSAGVTRALTMARRLGVEALIIMDGDWQHNPQEIPDLLKPLVSGAADIVSGSRFLHGERKRIPSVRGLGLRALTVAANIASGARITDSQTGFHAFSRNAIDALRFRSNGFSVEIEVSFLAELHQLRHLEVPISVRYPDRPKRNVFGQGARVLDGLIRLAAHYRPLLFFGVPSMALLLTGMAVGVLVVDIYGAVGELAAGYALLSVLLIMVGAIGLFAGLVLHVLRGIYLGLEHQIHLLSHQVDMTGGHSNGTSRNGAQAPK